MITQLCAHSPCAFPIYGYRLVPISQGLDLWTSVARPLLIGFAPRNKAPLGLVDGLGATGDPSPVGRPCCPDACQSKGGQGSRRAGYHSDAGQTNLALHRPRGRVRCGSSMRCGGLIATYPHTGRRHIPCLSLRQSIPNSLRSCRRTSKNRREYFFGGPCQYNVYTSGRVYHCHSTRP